MAVIMEYSLSIIIVIIGQTKEAGNSLNPCIDVIMIEEVFELEVTGIEMKRKAFIFVTRAWGNNRLGGNSVASIARRYLE